MVLLKSIVNVVMFNYENIIVIISKDGKRLVVLLLLF